LEDFERLLKAESEEEQKSLRRQFARTIKRHVNEVAEYILPDEGTFDFALMYIPAENIYYEIVLKTQPFAEEGDLYPYFLERRIIPVSPNSFYAYLQAIALGLKGLHVERSAREIIGHLGRLQGDLEDFQNDYRILGRHLFDTARKYDEAQRKLSRFGDKLQLAGETSVEKSPEEEKGDLD
jgi:DNA recombination protein RmuC